METYQHRLIRYLQDAHATELGIKQMLRQFADQCPDHDIAKRVFLEHMSVTDSQACRIAERLSELGAEPSGSKDFFSSLISKVNEMVVMDRDTYDQTTHNLIRAYATEHFEQGVYSSLLAYADACGDGTTAELAEEILSEEEEAAIKLFPLIEDCAHRAYDASGAEAASGA
jgi:ferritin-like metal-binding protein YciE